MTAGLAALFIVIYVALLLDAVEWWWHERKE